MKPHSFRFFSEVSFIASIFSLLLKNLIMQFLIDFRLPLLDSHLSGENQSLFVEVTFWAIIYTISAHIFSRFLLSVSKHLPWWELAKTRRGIYSDNAQDESIGTVISCLHHGTAGGMMAYGQLYDDPIMWRHGYLLEAGFELADLITLGLQMPPYHHEGMKPELKVALVFHHLPCISLAVSVFEAGLHYNVHIRAIGLWLLLGGFVANFVAIYILCLSISTQMKQVATASVANFSFLLYCRFYEFPKHAYYLIRDVQSSEEFEGTIMLKLLYFGATSLTLFNVAIVAELLPTTICCVKRAIDGVTPLGMEPVPKSREDQMKRRRSSLMVAMDSLDQMRRRSSSAMVTVMHLNVVEDIAQRDMENMNEEDMAALNATIASLKKSK